MSARGISLHIGVNYVDKEHYGFLGALSSCENDADTMQAIAEKQGFETSQLKTENATRDTVCEAIKSAARELKSGDFFLISYAGHGTRIPDLDGDEVEDNMDDAWLLFDGMLLDDEFNLLFSEFDSGVRLLMVSDSCHSGTMLKGVSDTPAEEEIEDEFIYSRTIPRKAAVGAFERNKDFYIQIQDAIPNPRPDIRASVRLLSGCQEHELSYGSKEVGRFTWCVNHLSQDGGYNGTYKDFHREIVALLKRPKKSQTPGLTRVGVKDPDFEAQPPFKI